MAKTEKILDSCVAKTNSLNALIEYSADSVVSKTLIDKHVGTITLFAFDKNQALSEHTAPFAAFVQVFDGKAIITIDGKETEVGAGEIIIMPANIPHSVKAPDKFKMMLVMIRQ